MLRFRAFGLPASWGAWQASTPVVVLLSLLRTNPLSHSHVVENIRLLQPLFVTLEGKWRGRVTRLGDGAGRRSL